MTKNILRWGGLLCLCPNLSCSWKYRVNPARLPARCVRCSVNIDPELVKISLQTVDRCLDDYQKGAKLMEAENCSEAINTLCAAIDQFHEIACPPHRETHLAQEALRSCFATSGNVHKLTTESDGEIKK